MKTRTNLLAFGILLAAHAWLRPPRVSAQSAYEPFTFTTIAGNSGYGSADGMGSTARFYNPLGVALDSAGNVYVADSGNDTIRKVTPAGVVTTLAGQAVNPGSADGTGSAARFSYPSGVGVDSAGNVYVTDTYNHTIRKVTPAGVVTTLAGFANSSGSADGTGSAARFNYPSGVALDSAGDLYVADALNNAIRKVTLAGAVTTLAGLAGSPGSADGTGSAARFDHPSGVALDSAGNVYVADAFNKTIRKLTPAGVVATLAGGFNTPVGVALDNTGNIYVADYGNNTISKVTPTGVVTALAGLVVVSYGSADGTGSAARFNYPSGVALDSASNVYVADTYNNTIRKVTPAGVVTTLVGLAGTVGSADGAGSDAQFTHPQGVAVDSTGNLFVADTSNYTIRKVTPVGVVTTLAGLAGSLGSADGTGSDARLGNVVGFGEFGPTGVAVDSVGNVYVADYGNHTIRKVTPAGVVTTLAGLAGTSGSADGTGSDARFSWPAGVAVDSANNVYVADTYNQTIRKVTPAGVVTTLAGLAGTVGSADGAGTTAQFTYPQGVALDRAGNVYVADTDNHTIRKVTPAGVVTTLAGLAGGPGSADATGSGARLNGPVGLTVDSADNVYVADAGNNTIRKGYPALMILNSGPGFGFNGRQFGFILTGPAGQLVVVEASTNLVNWTRLGVQTNLTGTIQFSDSKATNFAKRFYRVSVP